MEFAARRNIAFLVITQHGDWSPASARTLARIIPSRRGRPRATPGGPPEKPRSRFVLDLKVDGESPTMRGSWRGHEFPVSTFLRRETWMKEHKEKTRALIRAAGGVVMSGGREPLVAIVQLRKSNSWVLPKGKLNASENALAAARREVLEEVGHKVRIHEFLGTISHDVGSRTKVVQFWRMQAVGERVRSAARDVKAVRWLPLEEAIEKLSRPREQAFLESVAPAVREAVERSVRHERAAERRTAEHPSAEQPSTEDLAHTVPVETGAPADLPVIEPPQPTAANDFVTARETPGAPDQAPRDNLADKVRVWFRRISLLTTQAGRRA
jgi:8-oxo-dGTP diphosphatase